MISVLCDMLQLADDFSTPPTKRLTVKLYAEDYDRLERLKEHLGAPSKAVCIRYALRLYESFMTQQSELEKQLPERDHKGAHFWKLYWVKDGQASRANIPMYGRHKRNRENHPFTLDLHPDDLERFNRLRSLISNRSGSNSIRYAAKLYEALLIEKELYPDHILCWVRGKKAVKARIPFSQR